MNPFAAWIILAVLTFIAGHIFARCLGALEEVQKYVEAMKRACKKSCPVGEIHPALANPGSGDALDLIVRVNPDGTPCTGGPVLVDAEQEKQYGYYRRTGQIVCNAKARDLRSVASGSWFGYEEWLQEIASNTRGIEFIFDAE